VAALREEAGLSQEQLAERADLSVMAVSRIERGVVNSSILVLRNLAAALKVAVPRLVAEPSQRDLEIAALLEGHSRSEQARALAVIRTLLGPIDPA
jgi:transcriptional regulator with XRE-family HTH domain